jgi:acyl-CoA reductase-like NAD-dependent aldehyde dehydrogenase
MKSDDPPCFRRDGEPHPGTSEPDSDSRLDSWEGIAAHLRRSVRSARRWEKEEGLPVHRDVHRGGDPVYAYREELDDWWMNDARMKPGSSGRLDSWKEIATYLRSSVRSARRWEKEEGLPVHRHLHGKGDSMYAFRTELDVWRNSRGRNGDRDSAEEIIRISGEPQTCARLTIFE